MHSTPSLEIVQGSVFRAIPAAPRPVQIQFRSAQEIAAERLAAGMPLFGAPARQRLRVYDAPPRPAPRVEVPAELLGISTKSAAARDEAAKRRAERYSLQDAACDVLGPIERINVCCKVPVPDQKIGIYRAAGAAHFGGIMRCGSVWLCPVCSAKIAERRRVEIDEAIGRWTARGGSVFLVTLTFAHGAADLLARMLPSFLDAVRWMTGSRRYKNARSEYLVRHSIRALEVTWSERNGWHPHCHMLLFSDMPAAAPEAAANLERDMQGAIFGAYGAALRRQGLDALEGIAVKVQATRGAVADYVAKFGREPARARPWGVADEVTKSHVKKAYGKGLTPFDLLRWYRAERSSRAAALFADYAVSFHGRRQLVWSPGLRKALGLVVEASDQEVVDQAEEQAELITELTRAQWAAVVEHDKRSEVLAVALEHGAAVVLQLVEALELASGSRVHVERRHEWLRLRV